MRHFYAIFSFLCFFAVTRAQVIDIPDPAFKSVLLGQGSFSGFTVNESGSQFVADENGDGEIDAAEALQIYGLTLFGSAFNDLTGIEAFTNLRALKCTVTNVSELNLPTLVNLKELDCSSSQIISLDLSNLTALEKLNCNYNLLTTLDVNGLVALTEIQCMSNLLTTLDISGNSALTKLECSHNPMTLLNVSDVPVLSQIVAQSCELNQVQLTGVPSLTDLDLNFNQLTSLSVQTAINLVKLKCIENLLTSLDVSGMTQLEELYVDHNQLQSLDVSGASSLKLIFCESNQLSSLTLVDLPNFGQLEARQAGLNTLVLENLPEFWTLSCPENSLTELSVNQIPSLQYVSCHSNQLTTIDVSELKNLELLDCANNQMTWLFVKNGSGEAELVLHDNPDLQFICIDDADREQVTYLLDVAGITECEVNTYCTFTPGGDYATITANSTVDYDDNGCDLNDFGVPSLRFNIEGDGNQGSFFANGAGIANLPIGYGSYLVTPVLPNYIIDPPSASVDFPNDGTSAVLNFCLSPLESQIDVDIVIMPVMAARPGFDASYKLIYTNKGTQIISGNITFAYSEPLLDFVSSDVIPQNQTDGVLVWDYENLYPMHSREINLTFNVNSPTENPAVNVGDQLDFSATIDPIELDQTPPDNVFGYKQTVVGSIDPNDKTCLQGSVVSPDIVNSYLHYVIRFENTGTYAAQNVVVTDVIDLEKFDISSFSPITSSHPMVTRINNDKVEFIFENINLPFDDENNDGYVAFKIRTLPTLIAGDSFSNTASIYFDYNYPIVTNTAETTIQMLGTPDFDFAERFVLYPNPTADTLNIDPVAGTILTAVSIYNTAGQLLIATTGENQTDVSSLQSGVYFVKIFTDDGVSTTRFVKN